MHVVFLLSFIFIFNYGIKNSVYLSFSTSFVVLQILIGMIGFITLNYDYDYYIFITAIGFSVDNVAHFCWSCINDTNTNMNKIIIKNNNKIILII